MSRPVYNHPLQLSLLRRGPEYAGRCVARFEVVTD